MARLVLALSILVASAPLAPAGIFFNKHNNKVSPSQRVPLLLMTLKSSSEEKKREAAAEELRDYDPASFPEMIPVLLDVLQNDPKAGVRLETAQTLAKFRPVTEQTGLALEQAAAKDPSLRVRFQLKSVVRHYRANGFQAPKKNEPAISVSPSPPAVTSDEPPLASPLAEPAAIRSNPSTNQASQFGGAGNQRLVPRPAISAPPPLLPVEPPQLDSPPSTSKSASPDLSPPQ